MYYKVRSLVRFVFWLSLALAYLIVPFLLMPWAKTSDILAGELLYGFMLWALTGFVTFPIQQRPARHRE